MLGDDFGVQRQARTHREWPVGRENRNLVKRVLILVFLGVGRDRDNLPRDYAVVLVREGVELEPGGQAFLDESHVSIANLCFNYKLNTCRSDRGHGFAGLEYGPCAPYVEACHDTTDRRSDR